MTFVLAMMDASGTIWFGAVLILQRLNDGDQHAKPSSNNLGHPETTPLNAVALNMTLTQTSPAPEMRGSVMSILMMASGLSR